MVTYLLARPEVSALVSSDSQGIKGISTRRVLEGPCIRITRLPLGAPVSTAVVYGDRAIMQVDCFAGTTNVDSSDGTANRLAQTVRSALDADFVGTHSSGVVARIDFSGFGPVSDPVQNTDSGPARLRYQFTCAVTVRPLTPVGS